jgi:ferredoxin
MNRERFLAASRVPALVSALLEGGVRVVAPASDRGRTEFRRVADPARVNLASPMTALPLKALFFPPSEPLFRWKKQHDDVTLEAVSPDCAPTVVLGARPCDAAGVAALDKVMGWDYQDDLWFARREATTIVAVACAERRPDCFCEQVGLGPASTKGADVLLTPCGDGFRAAAITDKGAALVERCAAAFSDAVPAGGDRVADVPEATGDLAAVRDWLASHFGDAVWAGIGLRCNGCGACASVCPTCHCFDIVDEPDGLLSGTRRRNWDSCQASKFTLHASGHNPSGDQNSRFRQRVLHKFSIYPQRFGEVLCTGCGRCAEVCPAGQNIAEILGVVARAARGAGAE